MLNHQRLPSALMMHFILLLFSLMFSISGISAVGIFKQGMYTERSRAIGGSESSYSGGIPTSTGIRCLAYCSKDEKSCIGVEYIEDANMCFLFTPNRAQLGIFPNSQIYIPKDSWKMVLRSTSGSGINMYGTWMSDNTGTVDTQDSSKATTEASVKGVFKFGNIKSLWPYASQVKIAMYKDSVEVMYAVFDTKNTDISSWLDPNRVIESSYTDISPGITVNIFSVEGHYIVDIFKNHRRRLAAYEYYNGCGGDKGWFFIEDAGPEARYCTYEQRKPYPAFIYVPGSTANVFHTHADVADVFAIYLRF